MVSVVCLDNFWGWRETLAGVHEFRGRYEQGRLVQVEYLGLNGEYVNRTCFSHCDGYAKVQFAYDSGGNLLGEKYYDKDGFLTLNEHSYAQSTYSYDAAGRLTGSLYLDADGLPEKKGSYKCVFTYRGEAVEAKKFFFESGDSTVVTGEKAQLWLWGAKSMWEKIAKMDMAAC